MLSDSLLLADASSSFALSSPSDRPLCAMATFAGPSGYSYHSCTKQDASTETVYLTWQGGDATVQDIPRYFASYWSSASSSSSSSNSHDSSKTATGTTKSNSSGTATKSSVTATSTSSSAANKASSWIERHKWPVIGAIVGVLIIVLLLLVCCACHIRRKRKTRSRGVYVPAGQVFPGTQEAVPLTQPYQPYQPYKINYAKT